MKTGVSRMRPECANHRVERLLEGFRGDVLPPKAIRGLRVRITPKWELAPPCASTDELSWFPPALNRVNQCVEAACMACPVRRSCLCVAILDDEYGVWGGTRRGQRLHARARLVNGDDVSDVLAELMTMPLPATEYGVPSVTAQVAPRRAEGAHASSDERRAA
jgi:hypothetical protein